MWVIVLLISLSAQAQKKHPQKPLPPPPEIIERVSYARPPKGVGYSYVKKKYPFSEAATVLLISFTAPLEARDPIIVKGSDTVFSDTQVVQERPKGAIDTFGHKQVREIKVIEEKEIGSIGDMFYNLSCGNGPFTQSGCYSPRNAIIFLDKGNRLVAEMEICFECSGYQLRPKTFHVGDMRSCKYDELRELFVRAGVHFGVNK